MTKFNSLIKDIYKTLENPDFEISEDNLSVFLENLGSLIRDSWGGSEKSKKYGDRRSKLYASIYGLPPRRLWFTANTPRSEKPVKGSDQIRFLYGNILEELVLLLAKEAGHEVTSEQKRVEINGVSGKIDSRIDGMLTDVKSASKFSFNKFQDGSFLTDEDMDPFAYKYQLGLYMDQDKDQEGAFLVINKETGELVSLVLDNGFDIPDVHLRIEQAKAVVERDSPPTEKCYPEVPSGKSGNMILNKICSFCDFRDRCWSDCNDGKGLIKHGYSSGEVYFSKLVKPPREKKFEPDLVEGPSAEPS